MSKIWFIADLHINHTRMLKLSDRNFKTIDEMGDLIVKNINLRVKPEDTLVFCGDIVFGNTKHIQQFLNRLICKNTILVNGNHDRASGCPYLMRMNRISMEIAGEKVIVSHYPPRLPWYRALFKKKLKYWDRRPVDDGTTYFIAGHSHSKVMVRDRAICVCVDATNYEPISDFQISQIIQRHKAKFKETRKYKVLLLWKKIKKLVGT